MDSTPGRVIIPAMKKGALAGIMILGLAAAAHAQSLKEQREIAGKKAITLGDAVLLFYALNFEPDKEMS